MAASRRAPSSSEDILALQGTIGNRAVQRLLTQRAGKTRENLHTGQVDGGPIAVQRGASPTTSGSEPGLETAQGRLTDWAVAVNALDNQWTGIAGIGAMQKDAVQNWYDMANKDDPPPAWQGLLVTAVSIAAGSVTGGVGAVIANRLVAREANDLIRFAVNSAVNAGKDTAKAVAGFLVGEAVKIHRHDGLMAYKKSLQDTVAKTVDSESGKLSVEMNGLATQDAVARWKGMQELYDACQLAKAPAYQLQLMDAIESWLNMQAMANSGVVRQIGGSDIRLQTNLQPSERIILDQAVRDGKTSSLPDQLVQKLEKLFGKNWTQELGARVNEHAIADEDDVSQVGTLGFFLDPGDHPTQPMRIGSVRMDSSKGNTEAIRDVLLASSKTIAELKIPKSVMTAALQAGNGHDDRYGWFELAWPHDNSTFTLFTRGAGFFTHDYSDTNAGRVWLAMYGKRSKDVSATEITPNVQKGVARLEQELLHRSFSALGVSEISTQGGSLLIRSPVSG